MMKEETSVLLLRVLLAFFLLFHILSLSFGYVLLNYKFEGTQAALQTNVEALVRSKESFLEEVSILSQSKKDESANILILKENISLLSSKINDSLLEFEGADRTQYYQDKIQSLQKEKQNLQTKKTSLEKQVQEEEAQKALAAQAAAQQQQAVRRTRSS